LNKYAKVSITFAALLTISLLSLATNAFALTNFYFHISNIGLGSDVKFTVTNTATGQFVTGRAHILPFVSDTVPVSSRVTFPEGTSLIGCMTNFANKYQSCDYSTVSAREADFFVSAIPR
jgi:putative exporter of polyketide antibiotics